MILHLHKVNSSSKLQCTSNFVIRDGLAIPNRAQLKISHCIVSAFAKQLALAKQSVTYYNYDSSMSSGWQILIMICAKNYSLRALDL